ncbi:MAG TPA: carboxypeptidase-like regulatory domain-containing protein, partial [Phaeodactylibacter sp.]|nr:carboxypeptidase-like regulatory domain-containing protein [Phaeodactylibacter sp.]
MMHSSRLSNFLKSRVCFDKKRLERFGAQAAFFLVIFLAALNSLQAQCVLSGTITDRDSGEPLSFVSVYVKGQTQLGAVSNLSGYYQLNLPAGTDSLEIAFQYVGYRTEIRSVLPKSAAISLDVSLEQVALPLQGVEITA